MCVFEFLSSALCYCTAELIPLRIVRRQSVRKLSVNYDNFGESYDYLLVHHVHLQTLVFVFFLCVCVFFFVVVVFFLNLEIFKLIRFFSSFSIRLSHIQCTSSISNTMSPKKYALFESESVGKRAISKVHLRLF